MAEERLSERMTGFVIDAIDSGGVASDGVWLQGRPILGLMVPAMASGGSVNLQVSVDGGTTFVNLLTAGGTQALELAQGTGGYALSSDDLSVLAGYVGHQGVDEDEILARLVATASATAEREFTWLMVA